MKKVLRENMEKYIYEWISSQHILKKIKFKSRKFLLIDTAVEAENLAFRATQKYLLKGNLFVKTFKYPYYQSKS